VVCEKCRGARCSKSVKVVSDYREDRCRGLRGGLLRGEAPHLAAQVRAREPQEPASIGFLSQTKSPRLRPEKSLAGQEARNFFGPRKRVVRSHGRLSSRTVAPSPASVKLRGFIRAEVRATLSAACVTGSARRAIVRATCFPDVLLKAPIRGTQEHAPRVLTESSGVARQKSSLPKPNIEAAFAPQLYRCAVASGSPRARGRQKRSGEQGSPD